MIELTDFIWRPNGKLGPIRFYRAHCNQCGADRGYIRKRHANCLCCACAKIELIPVNVNLADFQTQTSTRLYRTSCTGCGGDRGYLKLSSAVQLCHSCCMRQRWMNGGMKHQKPPTRKFQYRRPDGEEIYFKSSYELVYAKFLDEQAIGWAYEPIFSLSNGTCILPDFQLADNSVVEVKGYFRPDSIVKWNLFCAEYPSLRKKLLTKDDLEALGIL